MSEPRAVAEADIDALRVHGQVEGLDLEENILSSGAYGVVYKVTVDGEKCVAKKLHHTLVNVAWGYPQKQDDTCTNIAMFHQECRIMSQLKHPNVVGFVGVHYGRDRNDISLIMERLHCDLADFVERNPDTPLCDRLHILCDVSKGLDYLHSLSPPLIHCNLTAYNILLNEDLTAKIKDFGVSIFMEPKGHASLIVNPGLTPYTPPECKVKDPTYTTKLDIFSFGVLILHTITGKVPRVYDIYPGDANLPRYAYELIIRDEAVHQQMGETHSLVGHCLHANPDQRPTAGEVKEGVIKLCTNHPRPVSYFTQNKQACS